MNDVFKKSKIIKIIRKLIIPGRGDKIFKRNMKHPTKEKLIEQLKALANDVTEIPLSMGAMCYSPAPRQPVMVKCESCGNQIQVLSWRRVGDDVLKKKIRTIEKLGFDAKVKQLCSDCIRKLGLIDEDSLYDNEVYNVFYFKTKEQEYYHLAISNNEYDYDAVIAFLKGEKSYKDFYDATRLLKDEFALIKRMTGISIE